MSGDRAARLIALGRPPGEVEARSARIYREVLARSADITSANFRAISTDDLKLLFGLYDASAFGGLLRAMLAEDGSGEVALRLSSRMTSAAGKTFLVRPRPRRGSKIRPPATYEIAVSTVLLFQTFGDVVRPGDRVSFEHDGLRRVGRVNRITKRATVLVEDPAGRPYSDGRRYLTFYVPLGQLRQEGVPLRP